MLLGEVPCCPMEDEEGKMTASDSGLGLGFRGCGFLGVFQLPVNLRVRGYWGNKARFQPDTARGLATCHCSCLENEPESKLRVSPLIPPRILPYITPFKEFRP